MSSLASGGLRSELAETDRYFMRRRQQLEATLGLKLPEGTRKSPVPCSSGPVDAGPGCSDSSPMQRINCVGPEAFPSPFREEIATGSAIAEEFRKRFTQACSPQTLHYTRTCSSRIAKGGPRDMAGTLEGSFGV